MWASKGLAINAAVSMKGGSEGTQYSGAGGVVHLKVTAGAVAVVHLKVNFPALVGATVPGMWEAGPDRAPEE